jgi:hypothetical protein
LDSYTFYFYRKKKIPGIEKDETFWDFGMMGFLGFYLVL